ncbi:hypothetical protein CGZ97_01605 [Enemella evansiae]|nr:hypothetical protein CGZ97_01605 [Enemella evansiae]
MPLVDLGQPDSQAVDRGPGAVELSALGGDVALSERPRVALPDGQDCGFIDVGTLLGEPAGAVVPAEAFGGDDDESALLQRPDCGEDLARGALQPLGQAGDGQPDVLVVAERIQDGPLSDPPVLCS